MAGTKVVGRNGQKWVDSGIFEESVADQMWAVSERKELRIGCSSFWPGLTVHFLKGRRQKEEQVGEGQ